MGVAIDPRGVDPRGADETTERSGDHASHLEQALLQARKLIESTVLLHSRRLTTPSPVVRTDGARLGDSLAPLIGGARYSVAVTLTGAGAFENAVIEELDRTPSRAVVRVLCNVPAAEGVAERLRPLTRVRPEVRVSQSELRGIVVVDGASALVQTQVQEPVGQEPEGQGPEGQVAVVNDLGAVRALELLFAGAWSRGRKLADHLGLAPRLRTEFARTVLEALRAGHTDETAARAINVSLRTYRRHVAEIMRELDASSRFQAGARAVELGLLAD
ncbi:response regulator transcription factor [Streptomyces sp. 110]|uniref:Response regulator transcription factor n=1 Tax=Streptomyces endocoffeicus TaxID=2898945 RepID=A0ABS1PR33_9ACTN|nr:response regulator transcription factor [Streptomyces endocoffeicus]MBL1114893.1 response regulator transcription factor [Streptomyces endocoffeicus]